MSDQVSALASEIAESSVKVNSSVKKDIFTDDLNSGLGLLNLKNHLMLDYLMDLTLVSYSKLSGFSLKDSKSVDRLVETRTVLEKIRPIESKLKYQIDKYLKYAQGDPGEIDDPLLFKPKPGELISKLNESEESADSEEEEEVEKVVTKNSDSSLKLYKAPKNVPMLPDGESYGSSADLEFKAKKTKISKSLLDDLKRQYSENPEEICNTVGNDTKASMLKAERERTRFEEDNFIRLPVTKKDKHNERKKFSTLNSLGDEITSFGSNLFNERKQGTKRKSGGSFKKGSAKKKFKSRKR